MRIKLALLVVILASIACTANVTHLNPASSPTPEVLSNTPVMETQLSPSPSAVVVASPTNVALGVVTVIPSGNSGTYPIKFEANGTYVDLVDSIALGSSKTYSVEALQGQIMSISVHQTSNENWTVIPMKIVGADGTTLCPTKANDVCSFWRGVLPATQNYFVTLTPEVTVSNFTLRVAVNPPGMATQLFAYASPDQHVTLQYSDEFAPVHMNDEPVAKIPPALALQFIDSSFYANTNLIEAYFYYGSSADASIVTSCTELPAVGGPEKVIDQVTLNGVDFVHSEGVGAGAGNLYDAIHYRALYNNLCYEITLFLHSGNIGNYPPDSGVKEFDRAALLQKFQTILATFSLK